MYTILTISFIIFLMYSIYMRLPQHIYVKCLQYYVNHRSILYRYNIFSIFFIHWFTKIFVRTKVHSLLSLVVVFVLSQFCPVAVKASAEIAFMFFVSAVKPCKVIFVALLTCSSVRFKTEQFVHIEIFI